MNPCYECGNVKPESGGCEQYQNWCPYWQAWTKKVKGWKRESLGERAGTEATRRRMNEKIKAIWDGLNSSERHGIQFGLFPISLQGLTHEEICELMAYERTVNQASVNNIKARS